MTDERKELGKIAHVTFGFGGDQDAMIGLSLTFSGKSWGCGTFVGGWAIERNEREQWSEGDRSASLAAAVWKLKETLEAAKKQHVEELRGVPVEVTLEGNVLKSWRVLTEVIP